jgi:hypothetical protein
MSKKLFKLSLVCVVLCLSIILTACSGGGGGGEVKPNHNKTWSGGSSGNFTIKKGGWITDDHREVAFYMDLDIDWLESQGYDMLNINVSFDIKIDNGIAVFSDTRVRILNQSNGETGASWSLHNTNTSWERTAKTVQVGIRSFPNGTLKMSFQAIDNPLATGTTFSNIQLAVSAAKSNVE